MIHLFKDPDVNGYMYCKKNLIQPGDLIVKSNVEVLIILYRLELSGGYDCIVLNSKNQIFRECLYISSITANQFYMFL